MKFKVLLYGIILSLVANFAFGQSVIGRYSTRAYTLKDGLPDMYILNLHQDSRGFLWIATAGGLSRFDGKNFVNYGIRQGLSNLYVNKVYEDHQHRLWVCCWNNIQELVNNRFVSYPFTGGKKGLYNWGVTQLSNGELWALTDAGTFLFNGKSWIKKAILPGYENSMCIDLLEKDSGIYYNFSTSIVFFDKKGKLDTLWQHASIENSGLYFTSMNINHDTLYVVNYDGIYKMSSYKNFEQLYKVQQSIKGWRWFYQDSYERTWVYNVQSREVLFSEKNTENYLPYNIPLHVPLLSGVFEDKEHNIWLESGEGLLRVTAGPVMHFTESSNPLINEVRNITQLPSGQILAFSRSRGILSFNGTDFVKAPFQFTDQGRSYLKNDFADYFATDASQNTWILPRSGNLFYLDKNRLKDYSSLHSPRFDLHNISYDPVTKQLYVCQDTLKRLVPYQHSFRPEPLFPDIASYGITHHVHATENGKILVNTYDKGIYMLDKNKKVRYIQEQLKLAVGNYKVHYANDNNGGCWMYQFGGGLRHINWDKEGLPVIDMEVSSENGLPDDMVYSVCFDKKNRIWVSSNIGLSIVVTDYKNKKAQVFPIYDYAALKIDQPENARLMTANDGKIWLAEGNNIYVFEPGWYEMDTDIPNIQIESISSNQQNIDWKQYTDSLFGYWKFPVNPSLPYKENTIQINFTGIALSNILPVQFSYRLIGLDSNWSNTTDRNYVLFAKLSPGKYRYEVKARTSNSVWSVPATFEFTIKPPFWNSWWFRLMIILLSASLLITLYRNRIKKIRKEVLIKNQLNELEMTALKAQMNPHFIYNALNSIQALVVSDKKNEAIHYIGTFSRLLRQVLEQSENNVISLEKELQTLEFYISLESLRLNMQPEYELQVAEHIQTASEKIPPLILQPFVENALWHGLSRKEGSRKIVISIHADAKWLTCSIRDNGIGREKAATLRSSGIHQSRAIEISRKRLQDFNESNSTDPILFEDLLDDKGQPAGTKVTLHIRRMS